MQLLSLKANPPNAAECVIFHGNNLCGEFYRPLGELLNQQDISVHLTTLPGYHTSPPLKEPNWKNMLSHIGGILDEKVKSGSFLVGHSLGALVALFIYAHNPRKYRGLILIEPAVMPYRWLAAASFKRYKEIQLNETRDTFQNWTGSYFRIAQEDLFPAKALRLHLDVKRLSHQQTINELISTIPTLYPLPKLQKPISCLVLLGENTGWRFRMLQKLWVRKIPGVRITKISDAAHFLVNENDPQLCHHMADFIKINTNQHSNQ